MNHNTNYLESDLTKHVEQSSKRNLRRANESSVLAGIISNADSIIKHLFSGSSSSLAVKGKENFRREH